MSTLKQQQIEGTIKAFNKLVPVGSVVTRIDDFGKPILTKTRTEAWLLPHGQIVVSCEGQYGTAIILERIIVHPIQPEIDAKPGKHTIFTEYEGDNEAHR